MGTTPQGEGPIRLLAVSDWADTGFGRVMRELLPRLAATGLFEIEMVAWVHDGEPDEYDAARELGVRLHHCIGDAWGQRTLRRVAARFQPRVVLSLGDPWMVEWIAGVESRSAFRWVAYVPIDRDPLAHSWLSMLSQPDVLVLYSDFGVDVVRRQLPFRHPEMIYHGVDVETFRPLPAEERNAARAALMRVQPEDFVVGMVCRNQERKNVPAAFGAFKAFNCRCAASTRPAPDRRPVPPESYDCPRCGQFEQDPEKEASRLYLHMTMGTDPDDGRGISWNIHELVERYGLKGRVQATRGYGVRKGVSSAELNHVYNLFDAHLITTKREGFCLPVLEAMAAGVPNVVTAHSACRELVEKGGGELIDVRTFLLDPHDEAESAIVDVWSAADRLEALYRDPGRRGEIAASGRAFAESLTWRATIPRWVELLHGAAGKPLPRERRETKRIRQVDVEPAAPGVR